MSQSKSPEEIIDYFEQYIINNYGNAYGLYEKARQAYLNNDRKKANKYSKLNQIFNNCIVPYTANIAKTSHFGYNGFGILIHAKSTIGEYCTIGTQVTIGHAAKISDYVYIGTGAKIFKNIAHFCVVGANAVVTHEIEPFSIVAGVPARVIKKIDDTNIKKYIKQYFTVGHSFESNIEEKIYEIYKKI